MIGMSASATISIEEAENVLLLPVDALQEEGGNTFVYTSRDKKGSLTGKVNVRTGLSGGNQVAITEGLEEGETVCYLKRESEDKSSGDNSGDFNIDALENNKGEKGNFSEIGGHQENGGGTPPTGR